MSKIILLLGPSGVGKTTCYKLIEGSLSNCRCCHLDGLASRWGIAQGWLQKECVSLLRSKINDDQLFLAFGLEAIGAFASEHHELTCVIDVGAGFQDASSARHLNRIHRTVVLTGEAGAIYERKLKCRGEPKTLQQYAMQEFSDHRRAVYDSGNHIIDTTKQSAAESAEELRTAILNALSD